jgi:adenylate cyclase
MGVDWAAEGLLEGLEGDDRESRIELLDTLAAEGCSVDDIKRADAEGQLLFILAGQAIDVEVKYTFDELVERSGVPEDLVVRLTRAQGFPLVREGRAYTDTDVTATKAAKDFLDAGLPVDDLVTVSRLLGRGFEQAAQAMRGSAMKMVLEPGLSERELAVRYAHAAKALTPMTEPLLGHLLRLHLAKSVQTEVVGAEERQTGRLPGARPVVVGFADLVGFTRLGEEVPADELGAVAGRLEELVLDVIDPPVRFVKTIGDAAMLVSPEGEPLLDTTLALVDAADAEGEHFPQLRAGLAAGEALSRAGDWFGRPVNLASRLTTIARPASVLTHDALREMVPDGYRWSKAGIRNIKGIPDPVPLWRVRRPEPEEDE